MSAATKRAIDIEAEVKRCAPEAAAATATTLPHATVTLMFTPRTTMNAFALSQLGSKEGEIVTAASSSCHHTTYKHATKEATQYLKSSFPLVSSAELSVDSQSVVCGW